MDISPIDRELLILAKSLLEYLEIVSKAKKTTNIQIIDGKVAVPDDCTNDDITLAAKKSLLMAAFIMTLDDKEASHLLNEQGDRIFNFFNEPPSFTNDIVYKKLEESVGTTDRPYSVENRTDIYAFTLCMIRKIGDIARSCGELLCTSDAQIACMVVFVLGVPKIVGVKKDTGYFTIRDELAKVVDEAVAVTAENGLNQESIPALVEFIYELGKRFETIVRLRVDTDFGDMLGGDWYRYRIYKMFNDHFHDMAHGHFFIRYLEKKYSTEVIRSEYRKANTIRMAK